MTNTQWMKTNHLSSIVFVKVIQNQMLTGISKEKSLKMEEGKCKQTKFFFVKTLFWIDQTHSHFLAISRQVLSWQSST